MNYLKMVGVFFGACLVHWGWNSYFPVWGLTPQPLLVMTIVIASRLGPIAAMSYGFAWGLFLDFFDVHIFGSKALALILIGYGVGSLRRQVDVSGFAPLCVMVFFLTWAYFLSTGILGMVFLKDFLWVGWKPFLCDPFYNCLIIPLAYKACDSMGARA